MKTFLKLTVALFAFGFATVNAAELSEAAKKAISDTAAIAKEGNEQNTLDAVKDACTKYPEAAAQIVSAVITALGGEDADADLVGKIVATAVKAAPDKAEEIVAAAIAAAPHAASKIKVSADGVGGNNNPLGGGGGSGGSGGQGGGPPPAS